MRSKITAFLKKQKSLPALAKISLDRLRFYSAYVQLALQWLVLDKLDVIDWKIMAMFLALPIFLLFDILFVYPAEQGTAYINSPISDEIKKIRQDLEEIKNNAKISS